MAVSTSSYFSNSIVGVPQVAGEYVDLSANSQYPKYALGTKYERQDGAIFRYGHFSAATSAGVLVAKTEADTTVAFAIGNTSVTPASTYQMANEPVGVYPGSIGSRYIVWSNTNSANQYAGAVVTVAEGVGKGQSFRIKGNTLTGTPATGLMRLELYDQITTALTNTSTLVIAGCKYNDLAITSLTNPVAAGVNAMSPKSAGYFGWIQTQGLCGVYQDNLVADTTIGQLACVSSATNGAITGFSGNNSGSAGANISGKYPIVGVVAAVGSATTMAIIDLCFLEA